MELQSRITPWRFSAPSSQVPDGRDREAGLLCDIRKQQPLVPQVPNARCPCLHTAEITTSRNQTQRYGITASRYDLAMTLAERIKKRLFKELGHDVKWLSQRTGIPVSTLYGLMNGDAQSSTKLPTIAHALGLRALWLEKEVGPPLLTDPIDGSDWPFTIARTRIDALSAEELESVEAAMAAVLQVIEHRSPKRKHLGQS